jgi:hypothetical protein
MTQISDEMPQSVVSLLLALLERHMLLPETTETTQTLDCTEKMTETMCPRQPTLLDRIL